MRDGGCVGAALLVDVWSPCAQVRDTERWLICTDWAHGGRASWWGGWRLARRGGPRRLPLGGASGRRATTVRAPLPVGYLPIKKCNKRLFSFYFSCFPNWFSFSFPTIPTLHVVFLINTYGLKDKIRLTFAPKNIDRHTHRGPRPERARAQQVTRLLDSKTAQSLHGTGRAGWAVGPVPRPPSGWRRCGRARLTASSGWCAAARGVAPPAA